MSNSTISPAVVTYVASARAVCASCGVNVTFHAGATMRGNVTLVPPVGSVARKEWIALPQAPQHMVWACSACDKWQTGTA